MKKQALRRKLGQLRASLHANPWALDVRALGMLHSAIGAGDLDSVKAILALGEESAESIARMINGIAVIPVTGVLQDECDFMVRWGYASSYQQIERDFNAALANAQVNGILFYGASPGGSAIGCKRLADLVYEARGEKPIRLYTQNLCCSAMYYVAAACDQIDATADALVGSIGTIYPHLEISGLLKDLGYSAAMFVNADSPKKSHGNMYEPLTEESRKTLQQYVDSYGRPFIEDVARYRGISPEDVVAKFGQGDALRADVAQAAGMIDRIVSNFDESLQSIQTAAGSGPSASSPPPANTAPVVIPRSTKMNERIKAQLFALGLISSLDASDKECQSALKAWFAGRGKSLPKSEAKVLAALQRGLRSEETDEEKEEDTSSEETDEDKDKETSSEDEDEDAESEEDDEEEASSRSPRSRRGRQGRSSGTRRSPVDEQGEALLADLDAAAALINSTVGREVITARMVLDAHKAKLPVRKATANWNKTLSAEEQPLATDRISHTGDGAKRFAADAVDALVHRAGNQVQLSKGADALVAMPIWAVAAKCLQISGVQGIDLYSDRETIADMAMSMGTPGVRHRFFSANEDRKYIQAAASPAARPGDFPNILSALAQKFIDTIELDEEYSYEEISALSPGGLNDFKPAPLINKGIVEELDEITDSGQIQELGLSEEVLSYLFLRRFANKWGWTPVLIANDDMLAFAEGMIGLEEAWQVTQNRLVLDRVTSTETLLDGSALYADRTNVGTAANNNTIAASGGVPSDAQWAAMEAKYADLGGVGTGRRVRGVLNTCLVPTGTPYQEALRTFAPLGVGGLEQKTDATSVNVSIYRGLVKIVPESELRAISTTRWYGFRSPTNLRTATVLRAYFNGYGTAGLRERWYDPETKTTWTSIEGRIAVAAKNWRYTVDNVGA